ncbi:hypothetical protein GCWU000282_01241 [Catonella morbi ATCC 51271]|uniref:Uncharacterized protein n=1 Tax=Catonella morbi ATCC 51271 TaxID=592026 RepID=V2XMX2_9FIRM|nr:hypothetical protein GCWU000282_01241 [Catonella morbi ATCC 51271]
MKNININYPNYSRNICKIPQLSRNSPNYYILQMFGNIRIIVFGKQTGTICSGL